MIYQSELELILWYVEMKQVIYSTNQNMSCLSGRWKETSDMIYQSQHELPLGSENETSDLIYQTEHDLPLW